MAGESDTSPGGQKRSRDYGEELKGLTPERHSDREGSSTPTRKKQRTEHSPTPDVLIPSGDGEANGLAAHHDTSPSVIAAEPDSAPTPSAVPDHVPDNEPAREDDPEVSSSQGPTSINRGVRLLGVRTSLGKPKGASATTPTQTPIIQPTAPSEPPTEDRPKSSSADDRPKSRSADEYSEGEVGEDDESGDDEDGEGGEDGEDDQEGESMPPTTPGALSDGQSTNTDKNGYATFRVSKKDWKLPKSEIRIIKWSRGAQTKSSWWVDWAEKELDFLIALLMRCNPDKKAVNRKVVSGALGYIHRNGYFVGASKTKTKASKSEAMRVILALDDPLWDETPGPGPAEVSNQGNGEGGEAAAAMSEDEEVRQLELYFPRVGDVQVVCLHCVSTQHRSESCPSLKCGFCESDDHMSYACPTKKRCTRCYQLGHRSASCQEKLALAKDERPGCAYCSARGHTEDRCPTVWRSYQPGLTELKKVNDIPCYCYMCGTAGHYGPECGLASKKQKAEAQGLWTTWSKANRDSYVDPESTNVAIAQIGVNHPNANEVSEFHIKGKATKKTHIHFISSDDSEGEFIQPPVSRGGPGKGGISISTNIVNPPQQQSSRPPRRARNNGHPPPPGTADMPPLPPGPPPPMVFSGNYNGNGNGISNGSQRSFHPLPPRPGGMNSNGGGGGGGRGGGNRGRGRGRGRTGNRGGGGGGGR
ncbi:Air1p [Apiospora saccharicola]